MLSILIPIYNFNVTDFVNELHTQAVNEKIRFEILLVDDASEEKFRRINKELHYLDFVKYEQLQENIGRSKIRNLMANKAKYDYLLFIDCDSKISDNDYIKRYIDNLKGETVICGGRIYQNKKPYCKKELLRWIYGVKRETKTAEERNTFPNRSFMTNNYVISKSIHKQIEFDEAIETYGHEDTLFGIMLENKKTEVIHINNPLIHIGLESATEFIRKTNQAIVNLINIQRENDFQNINSNIKLLKISNKLRLFSPIIIFVYKTFNKLLLRNLYGRKPSILIFDFYKLGIFFLIKKNQ